MATKAVKAIRWVLKNGDTYVIGELDSGGDIGRAILYNTRGEAREARDEYTAEKPIKVEVTIREVGR